MTNNPNNLISKPEWLRVKAPQVERIGNTANLLNDLNLNTVCQEASCPNIGECFASGTATSVSYTHLTLPTRTRV